MKRAIYQLEPEAFSLEGDAHRCHLRMPRDATFLCVRTVRGVPVLYALVDPDDKPGLEYTFEVYATGQPFEFTPNHDYIGTFLLDNGTFVFHVFRRADADRTVDEEKPDEACDAVYCKLL